MSAWPNLVNGTWQSNTGSGNTTVPYGAGIRKNDLIVVFVAFHHAASLTTPAGYTLVNFVFQNNVQLSMLAKMADGTESGNLSLTISGANRTAVALAVFRAPQFGTALANCFSHGGVYVTGSGSTNIDNNGMGSNSWSGNLDSFWIAAGAAYNAGTSGSCTVTAGGGWSKVVDLDSHAAGDDIFLCVASHGGYSLNPNDPIFTWTLSQTDLVSMLTAVDKAYSNVYDPTKLRKPWVAAAWDQPTQFTERQMNQLRSNVLNAAVAATLGGATQTGTIAVPGFGWWYNTSSSLGESLGGNNPYVARKYWSYGPRSSTGVAQVGTRWIKAIPHFKKTQLYAARFFFSEDNQATYAPMVDQYGNNMITIQYDSNGNPASALWTFGGE